MILVCDNLNIHTLGAFYEAFDPATARAMVRRTEIRHRPEYGSWLNVAECDWSVPNRRPCVHGRRFGTVEKVAGGDDDWQFRIDDTRDKLKSLCPEFFP